MTAPGNDLEAVGTSMGKPLVNTAMGLGSNATSIAQAITSVIPPPSVNGTYRENLLHKIRYYLSTTGWTQQPPGEGGAMWTRNGHKIGVWHTLGTSRYGNYLSIHADAFKEALADASVIGFAAAAWKIGTGPVMSPGYVRWHERILDATLYHSGGDLAARVQIAAPRPAVLSGRVWPDAGYVWRDWDTNALTGHYTTPDPDDGDRSPWLLTALTVRTVLDDAGFKVPPRETSPAQLHRYAVPALNLLIPRLNAVINPILARLDAGTGNTSTGQ